MLKMQTTADRGRIDLTGEIDQGCGVELADMLRRLRDECFYDRVELRITSPGGAVQAVDDYARAMRSFRDRPTVATHVPSLAGSAAALLASLGDVRTAAPGSMLLYHTGRMEGVESVTAESAAWIGDALRGIDRTMVETLADRARRATRPRGRRATVGDFHRSDWAVAARLVGDDAPNHRTLLARLRARVADALAADGSGELARLYGALFALDARISAALAVELRLLDRVGEPDGGDAREPAGGHVPVPEWSPLYPPDGRIPEAHLCRHVLVLGETGSGKTVSGVLPVVAAMLGERSPVGCMLVIDPKGDIAPAVEGLAGPGEVRHIDPARDTVELMTGEHSVEADLASSRYVEAAARILRRAATFDGDNPARTLNGLSAPGRDPYWSSEGARLAQTVLAFVLLVRHRATDIFGGVESAGCLTGMEDLDAWSALVRFGELAGVVRRDPEVEALVADWRGPLASCAASAEGFVEAVSRTALHAGSSGFRADLAELRRPSVATIQERLRRTTEPTAEDAAARLATATSLAAARSIDAPPDGPNAMALAAEALPLLFVGPGVGEEDTATDRPTSEGYERVRPDEPSRFPAAEVASHLAGCRPLAGDVDDIARDTAWWNTFASTGRTYLCIVGAARPVFTAFADPGPRHALRFGDSGGRATVDFRADVDADSGRRVHVFQAGLRRRNALVARAVKACYFEAVLDNPRRTREDMPLAVYVADEFQRFVTSDPTHGEQSYLDVCRSSRASCVLATQSVAGLRYALADDGDLKSESATDMLVANTSTKLVFRSTEDGARGLVERLCPGGPDRLPVASIRPPSTLRPGECYAALPDGRFERRQLLPFVGKPASRRGPGRA